MMVVSIHLDRSNTDSIYYYIFFMCTDSTYRITFFMCKLHLHVDFIFLSSNYFVTFMHMH